MIMTHFTYFKNSIYAKLTVYCLLMVTSITKVSLAVESATAYNYVADKSSVDLKGISQVQLQTIYLDTNGITIRCENANVGEKGTVNGVEYEVVDRNLLISRRDSGADLTKVCTSKVTDMSSLFSGKTFNQAIGNWDVKNVTNMYEMFSSSTFNQSLSAWNVSNVTNMSGMFSYTPFNQPIGNWNVSKVQDMVNMFRIANNFNQNIGNWDVSKVISFNGMFFNNSAFNNGGNSSITGWTTSAAVLMLNMFSAATLFNHSLGNWIITGVTNMTNMLGNSGINTSNYDSTLIGWSLQNVKQNVPLGAIGRTYTISLAGPSRNILTGSPYNWIITGDIGI